VVAEQRDYAGAGTLLEESLAFVRELGDKGSIAALLTNLGTVASHNGDHVRARAFFDESLALRRDLVDRRGMIEVWEAMALVAGAQDQPRRGILLWSLADAARAAIGSPRPPNQRGQYEQAIAALRQALGEEAYTAAWNAGKAMALEEAIAFALEP
jgi:tetratricopeptide (TPR) repeat protein